VNANRQIILKSRPDGIPTPSVFDLRRGTMPSPSEGQILVRNRYFSIEPAIRGWLDDRESYFAPIAIGEPIRCLAVAVVVASRHPDYAPGDIVRGLGFWEDYSLFDDATILLEKLTPASDLPLSYYIGALGGSGLTAYVGLHDIAHIQPEQTVVVTAAVGAVGSVAGQVARLRGCRVVALVGSARKAQVALQDLGYDAAINYREVRDIKTAIRTACPDGVDVYFDNVGGEILDTMLVSMKPLGRIVSCGMIAGYNQKDNPPPIRNLWEMVARQLTMRGFLLPSHSRSIPEAMQSLEAWVREGRLIALENKRTGLAQAPQLFIDLMSGSTIGKSVLEMEQG
jgi:NADPH-dependent curcumin reductase CurA